MAQTLYDRSPTRSFRQYNSNVEPSPHIPDTMSVSQLNDMSHNRSAPKKRLSRLELLRSDFNKKIQLEREEKINKLQAIQRENSLKQGSNGGGVVREFFAERRALEATRKGQKNPELLPPIESHFKQVKEQKHDAQSQGLFNREQLSKPNAQPWKRISLKQEPPSSQKPLPSKYSTRTSARNANVGVVARKRTKGIDKQDPLPPVNKGGSTVTRRKPPTPNKRYETHSYLIQDDVEAFEAPGPFMPVPPIRRKPNAKRSKVPLPPPSGEESASDYNDDALSVLTDYSSAPPNLSKLKAKALKQKQLSRQKLIVSNQNQDAVDNGKLTDFQKWQMEQDKERAERLEKHKQKSEVTLSQRENELLNKIKEEQTRLENLKQQRKELEEQEKRQKEEDEKWMAEKRNLEEQAIILNEQQDPAEDSKQIKKTIPKNAAKPQRQLVKKETRLPEPPPKDEFEESENIHDNAQNNFYEEATKDLGEVSLDVTPCSICRRKFASDRLAKHEKVCAKSTNTKRKVFDTSKHRAVGTDYEKYVTSGKHLEEPKKTRPKADWRAQHENFIKAIRYAKGASDEPPPPTENPDYVQCPHCERKFNPSTAERHIPKCKDIKAKPAPLKKKKR